MTAAAMYPNISLAGAAELVRAAVKGAIDDGTLDLHGFTVKVRSEDDSISTSIDLYLGNPPDTWNLDVLSPERRAFEDELRTALTAIACRYYTPDDKHRFVTVSFDCNRYRRDQR